MDWEHITTMPYGDRFRKHRRLMAHVLNSQAIGVYRDLQVNNTKGLLKNLLFDPEKFDQHIFRFVTLYYESNAMLLQPDHRIMSQHKRPDLAEMLGHNS